MITERSREQTDEKQRKTSKNTESDKITAKMISNAYDLGDHMAIDTMN